MLMTIAAYVLAFFTIGWGTGIITAVLLPLSLLFGRGAAGRIANTLTNGVATFIATYAVKLICGWLSVEMTYAMFVLPLIAMVSNDLNRIRRVQTAASFAGVDISSDPEMRQGMISTERSNLWADLFGFAVAILLLPPMPMF